MASPDNGDVVAHDRRLSSDVSDWTSRPWAMHRARLNAMGQRLAELNLSEPKPEADEALAARQKKPLYTVVSGVAVIEIIGDIWKEVPWIYEFSGCAATSTLEVQEALARALEDPEVDSILFRIDSPGGIIDGVQELADTIFEARTAGIKPVNAYIEDLGASAAYWIGSQAERLSANMTAAVGSIGVYCVYVDDSEWAKKEGLRFIVLRSGPFKGTGAGEPISDEELAPRQENINELAGMFTAAVARGRGLADEAARALATGRTWIAPRAQGLGLIDEVENFEAALEAARTNEKRAGLSPAGASTSVKEDHMGSGDDQKGAKPAEITAEDFAASHPEAVEGWRAEGHADGLEKGKADGKAEALESVKALSEALPDRPEAALKAAVEGQSPTEAKAALADELVAENVELKKKAAAVEAAGGGDAVSGGGAPAAGSGAPDFVARAKALKEEKKITLQAAMSEVAKEDPASFEAYKAGLRK